jgi:hypothetical protein
MLLLAAASASLFSAGPTLAQDRPQSLTMTCREVARLVQARGPIVIGTVGRSFDKFVRRPGLCEPDEIAQRSFLPTLDVPTCDVGYRCISPYDATY